MPRPVKPRFVAETPATEGFVPKGSVPRGQVILTIEGFEALRLSDFEQLDQAAAAHIMGISRQTYGRVLSQARMLVCDALVTGKEILIDGGHFEFRGRGRGRGQGHHGGREVMAMPRKDRTGPDGQGPATGRGRGGCAQGAARVVGNGGQKTGRGAGRGRGQGRGGTGRKNK